MTIKYSLTGPDATARQIRDLRKTQSESMAALAKQSQGSSGDDPSKSLAYTDKTWSQVYTSATPDRAVAIPYDSTFDQNISITVPQSGTIMVNIKTWLSAVIDITTRGKTTMGLRTGIIPIKWYDGDTIPDLAQGQFGGCQLYLEIKAANETYSFGSSLSDVTVFAGLTPGRKLNIRSRRYYWGWAGSPTSSDSIPSGSSYTITMQGMLIQALPI